MKSTQAPLAAFTICLAALTVDLTGCNREIPSAGTESSPLTPTGDSHASHNHETHAHATEGPHHGELMELGKGEYHAELVRDGQSVTIYILNAAANTQVPIGATQITINANRDGRPRQFVLAAAPDSDDPPGKSSRFVSQDADLADHVEEHGEELHVVLMINGKSYRGERVHDHSHANHAH